MPLNGIDKVSTSSFFSGSIDSEYQEIIRRLKMYGIEPTFDKGIDRAMLQRAERERAQNQDFVSGNFLTITRMEQQRIIDKKKSKKGNAKTSAGPAKDMDFLNASDVIGKQILLAIRMKEQKKRNNKNNSDYPFKK